VPAPHFGGKWAADAATTLPLRGGSAAQKPAEWGRWPERLSHDAFYPVAYPQMLLSRRLEERLLELFQKGYVKGTVTISIGNEATTIGMSLPLRPGRDPVSLLHRDFGAHLLLGASPYQLLCQYLANADSPTHGREGNVHHGDAAARRLPMMSHLGKMLSPVVGATWAARRNGERVFGLAVIGDGGSSCGEFHESLNLASVHKVPVLFLVENNQYAFSTPTAAQYNCRQLSDRAAGYGITGRTIDGTDAWAVYSAVCDALDAMSEQPAPVLLECMSMRLMGHAAYDKGQYVPQELMERWRRTDPLVQARRGLAEVSGFAADQIAALDEAVEREVQETVVRALGVARPKRPSGDWEVFAGSEFSQIEDSPRGDAQAGESESAADGDSAILHFPSRRVRPFRAKGVKNGDAVNLALDYLLANHPTAFLAGMDVGVYGSAFKTCKGLIERYGAERVIDMPLCESAIMGFALGASQVGDRPIVEFQFADFSTEAVSQLGLNAATWFYRSGQPAPLLVRLPCGGGLTMGAFHSGEFEGLWSRFPGLKMLYPATPQETFEALVAGFYDPNPCLVFEHKQLYWSKSGDIDFDGDLDAVWRPRLCAEGSDLTVVAWGAMTHQALAAARQSGRSIDLWNPLVLQPLEVGPILASVEKTGRLLVVQESGETQGLGDRLISLATQQCFPALACPPRLLSAPDAPVPFAAELETSFRPGVERIRQEIDAILGVQRVLKAA
jgi:2-oxoisovalerate dehydrogenase E1 component